MQATFMMKNYHNMNRNSQMMRRSESSRKPKSRLKSLNIKTLRKVRSHHQRSVSNMTKNKVMAINKSDLNNHLM
jgi:hypothetical protein